MSWRLTMHVHHDIYPTLVIAHYRACFSIWILLPVRSQVLSIICIDFFNFDREDSDTKHNDPWWYSARNSNHLRFPASHWLSFRLSHLHNHTCERANVQSTESNWKSREHLRNNDVAYDSRHSAYIVPLKGSKLFIQIWPVFSEWLDLNECILNAQYSGNNIDHE